MNISPINFSQNSVEFPKIAMGKRCVLKDEEPVPETNSDEVSFKGGNYEKVIREAMSAKLTQTGDADKMMEQIYSVIRKGAKDNCIKGTGTFYKIDDLIVINRGLSYFFQNLMRKFAGFDKTVNNVEKYIIDELQKELAKGDITLATIDNLPVFELRKRGLKGTKGNKTAFAPSNIYEFRFTSPKGGSEIIMGINPNGEISVERNSNMALPTYTLFHNSISNGVKVFMNGNLGDKHFVGKYFNRFGWYDPFLSMFIR